MKQSDWISVKDKLPRNQKEVLVCCKVGEEQWFSIATYTNDMGEWMWYGTDGFDLDCVTHWMPIVLPKED